MTKTLSIRSMDIPSIYKFAIGFDNMFDELMRVSNNQTTNYPFHNIVKISDDNFFIEIAVAGFSENEILVNLESQILTITGQKSEEPLYEYLYKGISDRNFQKQFTLGEHVEVKSAEVKNGILKIYLQRIVPEHKKAKTIKVDYLK
jgi:molecular chaperone IbpA